MEVNEQTSIKQLCEKLKIAENSVGIVLANEKRVFLDYTLNDGDVVKFIPEILGG